MKKRQEIQQEITNLNQQLRQHQIEQRKEQQSKNSSSMDDMVAGTNNTSKRKAPDCQGKYAGNDLRRFFYEASKSAG